uniref:acylaminoacyl-peptidase n=1 Tax=Strongyloides papillosus TaxID=174720 RepID=A0A0N5B8K3_STREA
MPMENKSLFQIIENLKKTYSRLSKIRIPTNARLFLNDDKKLCTVEVMYSQRSVEIDAILKQRRMIFFDSLINNPVTFTSYIGKSDNKTIYNDDNKKKAVFFSEKENDEERHFIQLIDNLNESVINTFDLSSSKVHGKPILSNEFGTFSLSSDGSKILYAAEKKHKASKYFDGDIDWNDEKKLIESNVGQKFILNESFGEQLNEIFRPVLCLLNVKEGKIEVIDEIIKGENSSPLFSLLTFDSKFIISFVLPQMQLKEGRIFCNNRSGKLVIYDIETKESNVIIENKSIECLINSPCGRFVYFMMREPLGPHNTCLSLNQLNLETKEIREIIPQKDLENIEDDNVFPGFFMPSYGQRSWSKDGKRLIISTLWKCKVEIVSVNIASKSVEKLTNLPETNGSWSLYDVYDDYIISSVSSPNMVPTMYAGKLNDTTTVEWKCLENLGNKNFAEDEKLIDNDYERLCFDRGNGKYECIFIKPRNAKELNLAVCVHGGPHGASLLSMPRRDVQLMLNNGYAVLLVNYHGSLGYGKSFVEALPGKCGTLEVDEIHHAKNEILNLYPNINKNNVCLFGGSHGGFAVTSLIGRYPNDFKACVALNPVLDFQTTHDISDIPDWAVYESLNRNYNWEKYLTLEEREQMFLKSPISLVEKVKTPYLLLVGEKDLRVVPHYRPYIRTLLARNVPCKILTYPKSNHPLQEVDAEADYSINTILWFMGIH